MKTINLTTIQFPEIKLETRDAHKLRGYFGNLFKTHSEILHNHYENGDSKYEYPKVQYKVLKNIPVLIGLEQGADLLNKLFFEIKELKINDKVIEICSKNIKNCDVDIGYCDELLQYSFSTLWMALNQKNFKKYSVLEPTEQKKMLNRIVVGNVLSFFKQMNLLLNKDQRLMANTNLHTKYTHFKGQKMLAFEGDFFINAKLANHIGIGKSVSRGFGSVLLKY